MLKIFFTIFPLFFLMRTLKYQFLANVLVNYQLEARQLLNAYGGSIFSGAESYSDKVYFNVSRSWSL